MSTEDDEDVGDALRALGEAGPAQAATNAINARPTTLMRVERNALDPGY